MATRTPPRFVPTLTEVVKSGAAAGPAAPTVAADEQLVERIMQRVDLALDRRLREAIAQIVLEQTRNLAPRLRELAEAAVRDAVTQAVADELAGRGRR